MSTETQTPHPNSFDGRFVPVWSEANQTVEASMKPGDVITSTVAFPDGYAQVPTMAKIDLGEHGELWITKMDMESETPPPVSAPHIDYKTDYYNMNSHSLMAVWRRDGSDGNVLWSNLFAGAGSHLRGSAKIGGGGNDVKFVRWGTRPEQLDAASVTLPEEIPRELVKVGRDSKGVVTITALEGANGLKVSVPMTVEHQHVLGERWANEIEAGKSQRFSLLANVAGRIARRLEDKSYRK